MSSEILQDNNRGRWAVVGYDNGLQTFYARIYEGLEAVDDGSRQPLTWVGTSPYEIASAPALADRLRSEFTFDADVIARLTSAGSRERRPPTDLQNKMFGLIKNWSGGAE